MYLTPVVIKWYKIGCNKAEFIRGLRNETREPYFDAKNSRRLTSEDGRIILNEFGDFLYIKNEISGWRFITNKTLLILTEKNGKLRILTISFPAGIGGFFYLGIGLPVILLHAINMLAKDGNGAFLVSFFLIYIFALFIVNSDFRKQNQLVKKIVEALVRSKFRH